MKIIRLTHLIALPATAIAIKNTRKDPAVLYYNIKHGSKGRNFVMHTTSINAKLAVPNDEDDILELKGDNYVMRPSYKANKVCKDVVGNVIYNINVDTLENHRRDIICYWEIPNKNYIKVNYTISGEIVELGKGESGKDRGDITFKSPSPVLEITGDGKLSWCATDDKGDVYTQDIHVDIDAEFCFDIQPVKKLTQGIPNAS